MSSAKGSSFLTKAAMEAEEKPMPTLQASESDTKPALNVSPSKPRLQPPNASSSDGHRAAVDAHNKEDSFKANEVNVVDDDNDDYLDSFPPGFRFCPHDEELVLYYLKKKVMNEPLPENRIMEVNLYRHNPDKLAEQYKQYGEKEWYFFTPRDKKYRNGTRPNRAAGDGYWKATGADKAVTFKGHTIGFRKALVFYKGKPPKGDKTNWIMHEYRVNDPPPCKRVYNDMRLDDWVLCRIYKKADKSTSRTRVSDEDATSSIYHEDSNELSNMDFDYNSVADSMDDYSNALGSFMHQSFLDGSSFSNIQQNQIHSWSIGTQYSRRQDDIWSVANLDFASQLDFYGVPTPSLINLDNILPLDPPKPNSRINDSN